MTNRTTPHRHWATASLITGWLWLVLSLTPLFITTVLGLPFASVSLISGWWSRRQGSQAGDDWAVRRANWGLGLSCMGCVWQIVYYSVLLMAGVSLLSAGADSLARYLQGTPMP